MYEGLRALQTRSMKTGRRVSSAAIAEEDWSAFAADVVDGAERETIANAYSLKSAPASLRRSCVLQRAGLTSGSFSDRTIR